MMELLHFIFSGVWTFLGCVVLLAVVCECLVDIVQALRK
jgi:hypothetical protein